MIRSSHIVVLVVALLLPLLEAKAACTGSSPNWTSTPDQASVQSCVNSASNGDIITLSAGSATYSSTVTISKGLTIQVASGQTVTLTSSNATSPPFFTVKGTGSNFVHISGNNGASPDNCKTDGSTCGLVLNRSNDSSFNSSAILIMGPVLSFRIDHVKGNKGDSFLYSNNDSSATGEIHGVIDHSYLINYGRTYFAQNQMSTDNTYGSSCPGGTNGGTSWHNFLGHQTSYAGTGNLIYFEDNQINWTAAPASPGQGAFYSQYGGMVVIRYNIIGGWSEEITDEGDAPACGAVYYEVYNNTITENCGLTGFNCEGKIFDIRSGNGLYHDNAFITKDPAGTSTPATLINYPNGAHVAGHDPNNIYWWNNTWDRGSGALACQSDSNPSGPVCVNVDGTSQAPVPTRVIGAASGCSGGACFYLRPPTTSGDVFFGYTPYTYPHPLLGNTVTQVSPPSKLTATVQ